MLLRVETADAGLLSVEIDAAGCVNTVQMLLSVETDAAGCM
jgi:hypothetical protein